MTVSRRGCCVTAAFESQLLLGSTLVVRQVLIDVVIIQPAGAAAAH